MKRFLTLLFLCNVLITSVGAGDRMVQFATMESLLAGVYDGHFSGQDVLDAGTFGLGTFEAIDGEMIVVDGVMYQALADGSVKRPDPAGTRVPFAAVIDFEADFEARIDDVEGLAALEERIFELVDNRDLPYAIRLNGTFGQVRTRAPQRQSPPYPPLAVVLRTQVEFTGEDVRGTMVGFVLPSYLEGINAPGIHLHFLSADQKLAGHVLGFQLHEGTLQIDGARHVELRLPEQGGAFSRARSEQDRKAEMQAVEAPRKQGVRRPHKTTR